MSEIKKYLPHLSILILPFVLLYWLVPGLSELIIGNDYLYYSIREELELQFALKHGNYPLFVPGFACGRDVAALTLGRLFHPLPHLASLVPGYMDGQALIIDTLLRLLGLGIAHLSLFVLLLRLRLGAPAAFIVSLVTVYHLRMLDLFRYGASLENYTGQLLLVAALGFYFIRRDRVIGPAAIILSTYLLITGGHPQMMYFGLLTATVAALVIPFALPALAPELKTNVKEVLRYYGGAVLSMAFGVLLASAYTIPFYIEFLSDNIRVDQDYTWSLTNSDNWGGALSNFFFAWRTDVHGAFGATSLIALILGLPALLFRKGRPPVIIWILFLLCGVVFLISLGDATPLHFLFWKYFPLASSFRIPGRITQMLPSLSMFLLAYLFSEVSQRTRDRGVGLNVSALLLATAAALLLTLFYFRFEDQLPPQTRWAAGNLSPRLEWTRSLWLAGGFTSLASALFLGIFRRGRPILRTIAVGLLCGSVMLQIVVTLRYGIWQAAPRKTKSYKLYLAEKSQDIRSKVTAGFGMESALTTRQLNRSIVEPKLAKLYRKVEVKPSEELLANYLATARYADRAVVLGDMDAPAACEDPSDDTVSLTFSDYNKLRFEVVAPCGGLLSLAYPFTDNWKAEVDGAPVQVHQANGYETAAFVPRGSHQVAFYYRSSAHLTGLAVTAGTLLLLGLLFVVSFRAHCSHRLEAGGVVTAFVLFAAVVVLPAFRIYNGESLDTRYLWSSSELPPKDNLAYAKRTRMSPMLHQENPYYQYGGRAVDGDRAAKGFMTSKWDRGFWQVDLGAVHPVRRIDIYGDRDTRRPFTVSVSTNGKKFKSIRTIGGSDKGYQWTINGNFKARYVRINNRKKGSFTLKEVEVYGR